MDIEAVLEKMNEKVEDYCAQIYSGKPIDLIFAITASERENAEDKGMKFFHELCFRFVLHQTLDKMMGVIAEHEGTIEKLKSEMAKMATVIDVMNQESAQK